MTKFDLVETKVVLRDAIRIKFAIVPVVLSFQLVIFFVWQFPRQITYLTL